MRRSTRPAILGLLAAVLVSAAPGLSAAQSSDGNEPEPAADSDPTEPPAVGQPELFSGAVGTGFSVAMKAEPARLRAGEKLTLWVTIRATGRVDRPPTRPDLRRQRTFPERFQIEPTPVGAQLPGERGHSGERGWTFEYRLRPRGPGVRSVPNLRLDYFTPGFLPPELGYQTTWGYAVPLTVLPADDVSAAEIPGATDPRIEALRQTLVRRPDAEAPLFPWIILAFSTPPVACGVWTLLWGPGARRRFLCPAARAALAALNDPGSATAPAIGAILTGYVRQRLSLASETLTAAEAEIALAEAGAPATLAGPLVRLLQGTERARFSAIPAPTDPAWRPLARRLIRELEAAAWHS